MKFNVPPLRFDHYVRQRLAMDKAGADGIYWFCLPLFAGFIYPVWAQECLSPLSGVGTKDMDDVFLSVCENAKALRALAWAMIATTFMRLALIARGAQMGPLQKGFHFGPFVEDGARADILRVARYVFSEWLPALLISIYVLIGVGDTASLFQMGVIITFLFLALNIWWAPVNFRYRDKNMMEWVSGVRFAYTPARLLEIGEDFKKKRTVLWHSFYYYFSNLMSVLFLGLFLFMAVQIMRTPPLHPDYERHIYADREPVWENNLYFAYEGLIAPAEVDDFYSYGRAIAAQKFNDLEALKKLGGISYLYEGPRRAEHLPVINEDRHLDHSFSEFNMKGLECIYRLEPEVGTECATTEDYEDIIKARQMIWDRFNAMPDYSYYDKPPQRLGVTVTNPMYLAQLKGVQIVGMVERGEAQQAFAEWVRYGKIFRAMAGAQDGPVFKAVMAFAVRFHMQVFEKILYMRPDAAASHYAGIREVLRPTDYALYRADKMLADDISWLEPEMLGRAGNYNAIRNDLYECILIFEEQISLPIDQYEFGRKEVDCPMRRDAERIFSYPFFTPGYFLTNMIQSLMMGGLLLRYEMVDGMRLDDLRMRMALLAVEMIRQDVAEGDADRFVRLASPDLQNPVTNRPFGWDAEEGAIYFEHPVGGQKISFKVNLGGGI